MGHFCQGLEYISCQIPKSSTSLSKISLSLIVCRLLNDYRKKCLKEMNLTEAVRAQLKFEDLRAKEMLRQL
jgi:hypothetical protein